MIRVLKVKKYIGLLIFCITCLLSLSILSNASAMDFTITAQSTNDAGGVPYCRYNRAENNNLGWTSYSVDNNYTFGLNVGNDVIAINGIECRHQADDIHTYQGNYVEMLVRIKTTPMHTNNDETNYDGGDFVYFSWLENGWFRGVSAELVGTTEDYTGRYEYWRLISRYSNEGWTNTVVVPARFISNTTRGYAQIRVISWTLWRKADALSVDDKDFLTQLFSSISNEQIYEEIKEQNDRDEEDRDNLEEQSSQTEDDAEDAGDEAEETGTTLFTAFTQLFTALSSINGNSCILPNIQLYTLNLGQMDLCTYDIPPQIMALVSIGMVFIIVPLGIHLVKKMINLYKELTG